MLVVMVLSGCGSAKHNSNGIVLHPPTTTSGSSSSGTTLPPGKPDTCTWLDQGTAVSLAGVDVRLYGNGAATYGPNIVCQYLSTVSARPHTASIALVATYLQEGGHPYTPVEWDQLVHFIDRRGLPLSQVARLTSPGYYGWSFGPTLLTRSTDHTYLGGCGFAKGGYAYDLSGQWTGGVQAPVQASMIAACEKIEAKI